MLGRAQGRMVALWLAALLLCLAWLGYALGNQRPALWPALGLVLLLCGHAGFLLVEFALARWQNRKDPAPRATRVQTLRAWLREAHIAPRVFGWQQPFCANAVPDTLGAKAMGRRGMVFVHGFVGNRGLWNPWLTQCRAQGIPFAAVNLEPVLGSIDDYAPLIDEAVQRIHSATGLAPVLVCHSMGGLAVRAWLRASGADRRVKRIVTLGTPHHGTWLSRFGQSPNSRQMQQASNWLQALEAQEGSARRALFTCYYSNCDHIVFPTSTAAWIGADQRFVAGVAHVALAFDAGIQADVFGMVDQ